MKRVRSSPAERPAWRRRLVLAALLVGGLCSPSTGAELGPDDRLFSYQLSYIEGAKAIEILTSLGYEATNLAATQGAPEALAGGDPDAGDAKEPTRPLIFNPPSSGSVSISGNTLPGVATGAAQQRLLIVWSDENQSSRRSFQKLLDLLHEQIDVPAKQILVEVLVIELDSGELEQLGVAFSVSQDGNSASFQRDALSGGPLPFVYQFTRPSVKTVLNLTAALEALVEVGSAKVLSQPSVLMLDGRSARIAVKDKKPFARVLSSNLDVSNRLVADTGYIDAGIELLLRARANDDNTAVTMKVIIDISSTADTTAVTGLVGPTVSERKVKTSVRVANDTPFVIGGLIRASEDSSKGGVPGLWKIPGLGRLFSRTSKNRTTAEVIVVITPHIIPPDDRSYSYTIPRDFDLFDFSDLELFRNVYRIKASDVFDLDFVRDSEFIKALDAWVARKAQEIYAGLHDKKRWPPLARGDRAALSRQLRKVEEEAPAALAGSVDPDAERPESVAVGAFLDVLEGGIPGEDKFVKRMLIEIVEGHDRDSDLTRFVPDEKIIFFPTPEGDIRDSNTVILDAKNLFETLGSPKARGRDCGTDVLTYERGETSQLLPFDPPTAAVDRLDLPAWPQGEAGQAAGEARFRRELRARNVLDEVGARWTSSAILLNDCYRARGRSLRDHLKTVLVLKRLLDLNPTLPLTLDGFHPGRDIVLPAEDDLRQRYHLVDWEAAKLFYETLDYYFAFETTVRRVLHSPVLEKFVEQARAKAAQTAGGSMSAALPDTGNQSPEAPAAADEVETVAGDEASGEGDAPPTHQVDATVRAWADSWSAQRAEEYLSFYAADFEPPNGRSLDQWRAWRKTRLEEPEFVQVELAGLEVSDLGPLTKQAAFSQEYRSDTYQDLVRKTLVLVRQEGDWKILSETTEHTTAAAP